VRRSIVSMFALLGGLSTTLPAQRVASVPRIRPNAIQFGFISTLSANWEVEALEIGYVRRPAHGLAAISLSARAGTFINESTMLGGTQGFAIGATLAGRTHMKSVAQLGDDEHATGIGFDVTLELSGYHGAKSPLGFGSNWVAVALLPAISAGTGDAPHFGIVIGPTLFVGAGQAAVRGMLAFRGEAPLARRERHP
jgi:hypothetical protein